MNCSILAILNNRHEYQANACARYWEEISGVAIAHRAYRLDHLKRALDVARDGLDKRGDDWSEAAELISRTVETAAKEIGDIHLRFPFRTH